MFLFESGKLILPNAIERVLCIGSVQWIEKDWKEKMHIASEKKEVLFSAMEDERCDGCCGDGDWEDAQRKNCDLVEDVKRRLLCAGESTQGIHFV